VVLLRAVLLEGKTASKPPTFGSITLEFSHLEQQLP
jgi:hypothetical protein